MTNVYWNWVDERNEAVYGYVETADHNGAAWEPDKFGFTANHREGGADAWEDSVTLHEMGHMFNARHYPNEADKNNCLYSGSVMNYCALGLHVMSFDSANADRVKATYNSNNPANTV